MADLTVSERLVLERLFGMSTGYVLSFSNSTFATFVAESVDRDVRDARFQTGGSSKANRLRSFWDVETNQVVGKLLEDLITFGVNTGAIPPDDPALTPGRQIASRLCAALGQTPAGEQGGRTVAPVRDFALAPAAQPGELRQPQVLADPAAIRSRVTPAVQDHTVLLVHGIRTQAEWQETVRHVLEEVEPTIRVIPTSYEFFDLFRFLFPFSTFRTRPLKRVTTLIRAEMANPRTRRLSLIGHSFGTWIIARILEEETDLVFHRIVLCGSVVPPSFPWEKYAHRVGADKATEWPILNECGSLDIWPVLAQSVTWGYGASGRFGFGSVSVRDRFHDLTHSGFFAADFVRSFWAPFLTTGSIVPSVRERKQTPWYLSVLASPVKLRWIFLVSVLALFAWTVAGATRLLVNRPEAASTVTPERLPQPLDSLSSGDTQVGMRGHLSHACKEQYAFGGIEFHDREWATCRYVGETSELLVGSQIRFGIPACPDDYVMVAINTLNGLIGCRRPKSTPTGLQEFSAQPSPDGRPVMTECPGSSSTTAAVMVGIDKGAGRMLCAMVLRD